MSNQPSDESSSSSPHGSAVFCGFLQHNVPAHNLVCSVGEGCEIFTEVGEEGAVLFTGQVAPLIRTELHIATLEHPLGHLRTVSRQPSRVIRLTDSVCRTAGDAQAVLLRYPELAAYWDQATRVGLGRKHLYVEFKTHRTASAASRVRARDGEGAAELSHPLSFEVVFHGRIFNASDWEHLFPLQSIFL